MISVPPITFLTCVDENYIHFVNPFIYFAKKSNPGSFFEIFVPDPKKFNNEGNVEFRQLPSGAASTLRFIVEPINFKTEYTYITDVDILVTEIVAFFHINHMKNLPFSNVIRSKKEENKRLTGLHFVKNDPWYKDTRALRQQSDPFEHDESILYKIFRDSYPTVELDYGLANRPVHGIHCSPNRKIFKIPGWELTSQRLAFFKDIMTTSPKFDQKFYDIISPLINHPGV